ncbi:response regulator [Halarsenatibacter silvermanii]|uniref:Stage 0 sporulation protein A homolog n=1 Tax=Halarsenatibacter silvermanii TaxID=321763 RepID=A0A1G9ITF0_9FIRM|nr:response regulator [Halarsenatibacter silvermanii]SDL28392.1 Response regulator receiver domain-containing protein [Halarsenatibacter silvermanii]
MYNILVVDDAGIIRYKLKNELTAEGFDVFEAPNAEVVYNDTFSKDISLENIDLVLLDIYLKDESGLKILEYIKNTYPFIKVIMVSVETKKKIVKKSINLGAEDYLVKPFDKEDMLTRINKIISRDDIKTETTAKKESFSRETEIKNLKTSISMELNRAIRGGLSFSLVKIILPREIEKQKLKVVKDNITGKIRDIDRVFFLEDNVYAFLLPLTDSEGREVFLVKIKSIVENNASLGKESVKEKNVTFPDDIAEGEKVNPEKQYEYRDKMMEVI